MLGCNRCGHIWDNCECTDKEVIGADSDMFEDEVNCEHELENRPYIGDVYKSKINENQLLTVCGLSYNSVTYEYLSTNVNMKRYKCQDITSIRRFLEITEGKKANE